MKLTNEHGLPQVLVRAIENDSYDKVGDISVTSLIKPPRMVQLMMRHSDEISEDVADNIWRLFGTSVHYVMERGESKTSLAEERLVMSRLGWDISGKPDLYEDEIIFDYKVTSIYAVADGVKPEWEAQLNIYKLLYESAGFPVKGLKIIAILRDWNRNIIKRRKDLPDKPVTVLEVPVWSIGRAEAYLAERIKLHQAAVLLGDDDLPWCTHDERWTRFGKWAVKKKGNKRALRLFEKRADAEAYAERWEEQKDRKTELEHRPGEYIRCENYCPVRNFCNQADTDKG